MWKSGLEDSEKYDDEDYSTSKLLEKCEDIYTKYLSCRAELQKNVSIIGNAYIKKNNIKADEVFYKNGYNYNVVLYDSGPTLNSEWKEVVKFKIPNWAIDDPFKYIKEYLS